MPSQPKEKVIDKLDLAAYHRLFGGALKERYNNTFSEGFLAIESRFQEVRKGRPLAPDDVMAIFDPSLPYVCDWTKPDEGDLRERMSQNNASERVAALDGRYDLNLIKPVLYCFRELSLTALVLQHVYPKTYSMCSHHIASLLYIAGHHKAGTVPDYYLEYCRELKKWGDCFNLSVVETEFALWTWYRLATHGSKEERREHLQRFDNDLWVKKRRASRIVDSLKVVDKLGFARFFLDTDHTLGAIIAWREFEVKARSLLFYKGHKRVNRRDFTMENHVIGKLREELNVDYKDVWRNRNSVMHDEGAISEEEARAVVEKVAHFVDANRGKFGLE